MFRAFFAFSCPDVVFFNGSRMRKYLFYPTTMGLAIFFINIGDTHACVTSDFSNNENLGGGLLEICPSISVTSGYQDNVFLTENDPVSDIFVSLSPKTNFRMLGGRHDIGLEVSASTRRYAEQPENNAFSTGLKSKNRFFLTKEMVLRLDGGMIYAETSRDALDIAGNKADLPATIKYNTNISLDRRISFGSIGFNQIINYEDTVRDTDEVVSGQDTISSITQGRINYSITDIFDIFTRVRLTYAHRLKPQNLNDNYSLGATAGIDYQFSDVTDLQLEGGILTSHVAGRPESRVDTYTYSGNLTWRPTDLLTIEASIGTSIEQTQLGTVGTFLERYQKLRISNDITTQTDIFLGGGMTHDKIQGSPTKATTLSTEAGIGYTFGENYKFSLLYRYAKRFGQNFLNDYENNSVSISLSAAL